MADQPTFTPEEMERESAEGLDAFGPEFTRDSDMLRFAAATSRRLASLEDATRELITQLGYYAQSPRTREFIEKTRKLLQAKAAQEAR